MKKLVVAATLAVCAPAVLPVAHFVSEARADSPQERRREQAADRIENAFERDPVLRRYDLEADAEGDRRGYIEIEGRVTTNGHRVRAMNIARRTAPGYRLVDRIRVGR